MISQLFQEDDGGRQCLGLYGMGGLGKTTMCKALCSYFGPSFNHKVYHLQIGSNDCKISEKNLFERHKELLRKLIGLSEDEIKRIQNPRQVLLDQSLIHVITGVIAAIVVLFLIN